MNFETDQLLPLDLSCKGPEGGIKAESCYQDDRRLSNSSDFTDRSPSRSPCSSSGVRGELAHREGGPRKRYLSKHFTTIKGRLFSLMYTHYTILFEINSSKSSKHI